MMPRRFPYARHAPFPVAARPLEISEMEAIKLCKGRGVCRPTGTFLVTVPLKNRYAPTYPDCGV
jgi:hypothetical protein